MNKQLEDLIKSVRISDELEEAIGSYARCFLLTRVDACKIEAVARQLVNRGKGQLEPAEIVAVAAIEVRRQNLVARERELDGHPLVRFFKYVDDAVMQNTVKRTAEWLSSPKSAPTKIRQSIIGIMGLYRRLVM
ncbi:MAG: hypothetical protein WCT39_06535 [Candidatus Margulisiibacteriota bacterium]